MTAKTLESTLSTQLFSVQFTSVFGCEPLYGLRSNKDSSIWAGSLHGDD